MTAKKIGDMELYEVEDLASLLGIQERTIRRLLRDGTLKGKKLAKRWYVTDRALQEYFNSTDQPATDQEEPEEELEEERAAGRQ